MQINRDDKSGFRKAHPPSSGRPSRARLVILLTAAILVTVASYYGLRWSLQNSDLFPLEHFVLARPCERLSLETIKKHLSLDPGRNLFQLDLREIRRSLVDHHWVSDVRVRRIPPHTIEILVSERTPEAVVTLPQGPDGSVSRYYLVDRRGRLFTEVSGEDAAELTKLTGFTEEGLQSEEAQGQRMRELLKEAVNLIELAQSAGGVSRDRIGEIFLDENRGFSIVLDRGRTRILLGWSPHEEAFRHLTMIRAGLGENASRLEKIDLSRPGVAIVKGLKKRGST